MSSLFSCIKCLSSDDQTLNVIMSCTQEKTPDDDINVNNLDVNAGASMVDTSSSSGLSTLYLCAYIV